MKFIVEFYEVPPHKYPGICNIYCDNLDCLHPRYIPREVTKDEFIKVMLAWKNSAGACWSEGDTMRGDVAGFHLSEKIENLIFEIESGKYPNKEYHFEEYIDFGYESEWE